MYVVRRNQAVYRNQWGAQRECAELAPWLTKNVQVCSYKAEWLEMLQEHFYDVYKNFCILTISLRLPLAVKHMIAK